MTHWRVMILVHTDLVRKEPRRGVPPSGLCSEGRARREPWGASFSLTSTTHIAGVPWPSQAQPSPARLLSCQHSVWLGTPEPGMPSGQALPSVAHGQGVRGSGRRPTVAGPLCLPSDLASQTLVVLSWFVPLPCGSCSCKWSLPVAASCRVLTSYTGTSGALG